MALSTHSTDRVVHADLLPKRHKNFKVRPCSVVVAFGFSQVQSPTVSKMSTRDSILILEHHPLIAIDLESSLRDPGGYENIAILSSVSEALRYIRDYPPSLAITGCRLNEDGWEEAARLLVTQGIPFIVCSGSERGDVDPVFAEHGTWIAKPHSDEELVSAVRHVLTSRVSDQTAAKRSKSKRGPSPRGYFDETKATAVAIIEGRRRADREKTERLRGLRQSHSKPSDSTLEQ